MYGSQFQGMKPYAESVSLAIILSEFGSLFYMRDLRVTNNHVEAYLPTDILN